MGLEPGFRMEKLVLYILKLSISTQNKIEFNVIVIKHQCICLNRTVVRYFSNSIRHLIKINTGKKVYIHRHYK